MMQDPHALTATGGASIAGCLLERLAAVQYASRDTDEEIRAVFLGSENWSVTVGGPRGSDQFGPFSYGGEPAALVEEFAEEAGLMRPLPGSAVPVYPEPGAHWRHFWAELLQNLGVHGYALRDGGGTKRYESVELDREHSASVTVVDEEGSRWISRIALDPPLLDMAGVGFDISYWIGMGQGRQVGDRTKVLELRN